MGRHAVVSGGIGLRWLLGLACALGLAACGIQTGRYADQEAATRLALETFRGMYNAQRFQEICTAVPEPGRPRCVAGFVAIFGHVGAWKATGRTLSTCFPHEVRILALSTFEKGEASEAMIWSVRDGKASLVDYKAWGGESAFPQVDAKYRCSPSG